MNEKTEISNKKIPMNEPPGPCSTRPKGCPRCQGLLVETFFQVDLLGDSGSCLPRAWRCVNCGVLLDQRVLKNQALDSDQSRLSVSSSDQTKSRTPRGKPRLHVHVGHVGRR